MKKDFTDDNFEDFLRQSADSLRMRPSDKVWKGISSKLHQPKRRRGLLAAGLLVLFCFSGYLIGEQQGLWQPGSQSQENGSTQNRSNGNNTATTSGGNNISGRTVRDGSNSITNLNSATSANNNSSAIAQQGNGRSSSAMLALAPGTQLSNSTVATPAVNTQNTFTPTIVDSYDDNSSHTAKAEQDRVPLNLNLNPYPQTIESVINSYRNRRKKKVSFQFYVTPTISYRRLSENKSFLRSPDAVSARGAIAYNVNSAVTHKPNLGLEMGMAAKYPLSDRLKLRAGLQVNVTRYDIKAYNSNSELATIMLNVSNNRVDSLNTVTGLSNTDGYQSDWLQNLYFQISVPVGVEYKIAGNNKVQFGIATSIQPTYILGERAYLISTDYKNYAELPGLTRRWNVNTSFETFVNYSTGKVAWQVGPQVRYQLLSSFISKYPVKENLFDFGLRVGLSIAK